MSLINFHNSLPKVDLITVDLGNSHPHVGLFHKGELKEVRPLKENISKEIQNLKESQNLPLRLCSVRSETPSSFSDHIKDQIFLDMPVHYQKTLGHDRLMGSFYLFHALKSPFLFIDAGTFLTLDFGNESGYEGGYILPGLKTFLSSYKRGDQLQYSIEDIELEQFPHSTKAAISSGAALYQKGIIREITDLAKGRRLILSGGEANSFHLSLASCELSPHLLHYALYFQYVKYEI